MSNVGKWHHDKATSPFGTDLRSYQLAMAWFAGHGRIEDWGCGTARAKDFTENEYVGVDGSVGYADVIADLETYKSEVPCVLLRHVLEHNYGWRAILRNALESFTRRMVVVLFTPLVPETKIINVNDKTEWWDDGIPDIAFALDELLAYFGDTYVKRDTLNGPDAYGVEHVFYLEKDWRGMEKPWQSR